MGMRVLLSEMIVVALRMVVVWMKTSQLWTGNSLNEKTLWIRWKARLPWRPHCDTGGHARRRSRARSLHRQGPFQPGAGPPALRFSWFSTLDSEGPDVKLTVFEQGEQKDVPSETEDAKSNDNRREAHRLCIWSEP